MLCLQTAIFGDILMQAATAARATTTTTTTTPADDSSVIMMDEDAPTTADSTGAIQPLEWFSRPDNGKGPQQQMFDDADTLGKSVFVARDSSLGKGGIKEYASLQSHEELAEILLSTKDQECCVYELIREGTPCRLYLDLEWESESMTVADAHRVLSNVVTKLCSFLQERYEITPRLIALDSSRAKASTTKYSYHVCACNVAFASNFRSMKSTVEDFASQHDSDPLFFCNSKPVIDLSVYTKNRCFRTPLSHKRDDETRTRLQRVNGPSWKPMPFTSAGDLLDALVTYVPDNYAVILPDPVAVAAPPLQRRGRVSSSSTAPSKVPKSLPTTQQAAAMQALLDEMDIKGFRVVDAKMHENGRTIYLCRNEGKRQCLSNPSETHMSNNPYLQLEPDGTVLHICHASTCKDRGPFTIGRLESVLSTDSPMSAPSISLGSKQNADSSQDGREQATVQHDVGASIDHGRSESIETREASAQTWVFHEKPFDQMFSPELIAQVDPSCKVMEARADRFQSGSQGHAMPGTSSSCNTYRDPPGGYLLTARRDKRSDAFRFDRYAKGIIEAAKKWGGLYRGRGSCALVSLVIAAASDFETAQKRLEPLCKSKKKGWKKGCATARKIAEEWLSTLDDNRERLALQALQRLFVEGDNNLFREEYETYEVVKANVERQFCKIEFPFHFIQMLVDGYNHDFKPVTERDLKGRMKNQYYFGYKDDPPAQEGGPVTSWTAVKLPFFYTWQADETIQTASQLEFDPSQGPGIERDGKFNTWTDVAAARMPSVPPEDAAKLYHKYAQHCFDVLGDRPGNFMLDYFAHILQRPHVKTGVAVLIAGPQGGGKGTIFDIFRSIVGSTHSFRTAKAKEHLFSRFSIGLKKTIFVQVDEPSCLVEIDNLLKDLATCDVMPFEEKGVQPFSLKVLSNFVVSSNDDGLVKIADGERRWVAFKCNKTHKDDHPYFKDLRDSIDNPAGLRSIYQCLMERDISHIYNMQAERVLTDYYMQCRSLFLSPLLKFLSALYTQNLVMKQVFAKPKRARIAWAAPTETGNVVRETVVEGAANPVDEFGSEQLRQLFTEFLETTKLGDPRGWNQRVFGDRMGEHVEVFRKRAGEVYNDEAKGSGVSKTEGVAGNMYSFDFAKLKDYLDSRNFFDEDAEIPLLPVADLQHSLPPPSALGVETGGHRKGPCKRLHE
eukprot:CAMPEP_0173468834 /NCGR_PEP_ID=MMETSP1357-20121228/77047_1 /TAXON_ID=77926 /ORGANISM="Hemiselmis rufescens, Strain PCC563" /LENGTH=1180 /DNA_ID=CAMNT_0014437057 /DNA_START=1837 /DNA_END=5379 /DNA_ORIENTATION=-